MKLLAIVAIATLSPPSAGAQWVLAQATSNVCRTPSVSCVLPESAPVGSPCYCTTSTGPVSGQVE